MDPIAVFYLSADLAVAASALASRHSLPVVDASAVTDARTKHQLSFYRKQFEAPKFVAFLLEQGVLKLLQVEVDRVVTIAVDFTSPEVNYRRLNGGGRGEAIARAVGLRGEAVPSVLDATAGLGGDAYVLASLGCQVRMLERVPALAELLADGLSRGVAASVSDSDSSAILRRMELIEADAINYLNGLSAEARPDVIYLDPMFPERRKSAAVKKEMQVLHHLVGPDADASELLLAALAQARQRVVIKRPRSAGPVAGQPPDHVIEGVRNRFDLYTRQS
jgi:16S rRNA (guanine1516-N2)-methyltransferase